MPREKRRKPFFTISPPQVSSGAFTAAISDLSNAIFHLNVMAKMFAANSRLPSSKSKRPVVLTRRNQSAAVNREGVQGLSIFIPCSTPPIASGNNQKHDAEHEQPMLHADEFRKRQFKIHHARQQFVNRAAHDNREEAEDLQLRLRRAEPGEFRDAADMRASPAQ